MCIFNGFATKKQQLLYFELSQTFIQTLIRRIIKMYRNETCQEKSFRESMMRLYTGMNQLEQYKHAIPKYSQYFLPLFQEINVKLDEQKKIIQQNQIQIPNPENLIELNSHTTPLKKPRIFSSKKSSATNHESVNHQKQYTLGMLPDSKKILSKYPGHIIKQDVNEICKCQYETIRNRKLKYLKYSSSQKYKWFKQHRQETQKKYTMLVESLLIPKLSKRKKYERKQEISKFNSIK